MGICDSSELKLLESLKINQLVLGPQHHKCAQVMEKLAELYKVPGKVQQADSLLRIVKILEPGCSGVTTNYIRKV